MEQNNPKHVDCELIPSKRRSFERQHVVEFQRRESPEWRKWQSYHRQDVAETARDGLNRKYNNIGWRFRVKP